YQTGPDNQLLSDGSWTMSYDAEGNITQKVNSGTGQTWKYTFNDANQMLTATLTNSSNTVLTQASYTYDVFGNRVQSSVSQNGGAAVVTKYAYGMSGLWADLSSSNSLQMRYVGGDQAN